MPSRKKAQGRVRKAQQAGQSASCSHFSAAMTSIWDTDYDNVRFCYGLTEELLLMHVNSLHSEEEVNPLDLIYKIYLRFDKLSEKKKSIVKANLIKLGITEVLKVNKTGSIDFKKHRSGIMGSILFLLKVMELQNESPGKLKLSSLTDMAT
jgi:hypothetical protein